MISAKAITPKTKFKPGIFRAECERAMQEVATGLTKDFEKTTATWEHEVEFESTVTVGKTVNLTVGTDDEIYRYVDKGTRRHFIKPKKAGGVLAFPGGKYRAKSKPRFIGSMAGGSSGATAFSKGHWVSGIKPRKWTEELFKRWRSRIYNSVTVAFSRAAKQSGYRM